MNRNFLKMSALAAIALSPLFSNAQMVNELPNLRPYDKTGINVFEAPKENNTEFDGIKIKLGAGFTQNFQALKHENAAGGTNLYPRLAPGFSVAQANLNIDALLADGVLLNVTTYLSSRHHSEAWVKGGYIQLDKLPFIKNDAVDRIMEKVRFKAGHMEINYGDAHFRRSDGGHTLQNPFVENNIVDAFATEVAGEIYYMDNGITGMIGVSNGLINGGHQKPLVKTTGTETFSRNPSVYAKLAYDNDVADNVRLRVSGSVYHNNSDGRSTLYAGDRTGSNYFFAMEPALQSNGSAITAATNFTTGRFNPSFTNQITSGQFNAFLKASGFELFGTFETGKGRTIVEKADGFDKRSFNQIAADALYRFGAKENAYIGVKYNTVKGALLTNSQDKQSIDRIAAAAGWFITKNILLKGEYVNQNYKDFPGTSHLDGGKFHGVVFSASVGF